MKYMIQILSNLQPIQNLPISDFKASCSYTGVPRILFHIKVQIIIKVFNRICIDHFVTETVSKAFIR